MFPSQRMNVAVKPGLPILMAGSSSPCVMLSVSAIGVTDTAEKNREHSAKICKFLAEQLVIPADRYSTALRAQHRSTSAGYKTTVINETSSIIQGMLGFQVSSKVKAVVEWYNYV